MSKQRKYQQELFRKGQQLPNVIYLGLKMFVQNWKFFGLITLFATIVLYVLTMLGKVVGLVPELSTTDGDLAGQVTFSMGYFVFLLLSTVVITFLSIYLTYFIKLVFSLSIDLKQAKMRAARTAQQDARAESAEGIAPSRSEDDAKANFNDSADNPQEDKPTSQAKLPEEALPEIVIDTNHNFAVPLPLSYDSMVIGAKSFFNTKAMLVALKKSLLAIFIGLIVSITIPVVYHFLSPLATSSLSKALVAGVYVFLSIMGQAINVLIICFVVFKTQSVGEYFKDLGGVIKYVGGQFFNFALYIALVLIMLPTVTLFVVGAVNQVFGNVLATYVSVIMNFVVQFGGLVVQFSYFFIAFFITYFYYKIVDKKVDDTGL